MRAFPVDSSIVSHVASTFGIRAVGPVHAHLHEVKRVSLKKLRSGACFLARCNRGSNPHRPTFEYTEYE